MKSRASKLELASWIFLGISVLFASLTPVLLYFDLVRAEQLGNAQLICLPLSTASAILAAWSTRKAAQIRKKLQTLGLSDYLNSEFPFKD